VRACEAEPTRSLAATGRTREIAGTMIVRTLEVEVMDTEEEARDYDAMDHSAVNGRFCEDLLRFRGDALLGTAPDAEVLDVGTGSARIPIELCSRVPSVRVIAIDLAEHMLTVARENIAKAGMQQRITLEKRDAKAAGWPDGKFAVTMSNTILHHIPDPSDLLREMWRLTAKGGTIFIRDLARPESVDRVKELVRTYGGDPKAAADARQNALFEASLHAGLTLEEIRERVRALGIAPEHVQMTSDRHWTLACTK
jgi:ubiquinone/menaquinone biosynthesis C-methylase UbiE